MVLGHCRWLWVVVYGFLGDFLGVCGWLWMDAGGCEWLWIVVGNCG